MPTKKEKLKEFHQNRITESAKTLFADKGINSTSMDDIASHSEYSKTTLYAYFKSKDDILNCIILEHTKLLKSAIETNLNANSNFTDGYFAVCNALADFYDKYPAYFEMFQGKLALPNDNDSESVVFHIYEIGEEIGAIIEAYIKTHMESVNLAIPPLQATFILWSGLSGIIMAANKKEMYVEKSMGVSKSEIMQNGFELLLKSIIKE